MRSQVTLDKFYAASSDTMIREIENELIIIPFETCIDNAANEPFILNRTGRSIWNGLDGSKNLKDIAADLAAELGIPATVIEKDVVEFVEELLKLKLLVEVSGS